jgi:anti-sigma-K factor RskA
LRSRWKWRRKSATTREAEDGGWNWWRRWREKVSVAAALGLGKKIGKKEETEEEAEGLLFIAKRGGDRLG